MRSRSWTRRRMISPMIDFLTGQTPTYEETAAGYAIAAMRMAELPPDIIRRVVVEMNIMIDKYTPAEAARIATESPYLGR